MPKKANGRPPQCPIPAGTSHPIHASTGNKYWTDTDYQAALTGSLYFARFYNSQNTAIVGTLGTAWHHSYGSVVKTGLTLDGAPVVYAARAEGNAYAFTANGTTYQSKDPDITDQLVELTDASGVRTGWKYLVAHDNSIEVYNAHGKLVSITNRQGMKQTLTYSDSTTSSSIAPKPGYLIRVTDAYGRQLNFTYDSAGHMTKMTDPAGKQYAYQYDGVNNLISVTYPDSKIKKYQYYETTYTGGANLPNALTGITDENGVRYASYYYDKQGRAYKELHAGGVDQYQLAYNSDGSSTTITDPLSTARTTTFSTVLGAPMATGQSQPGGAGCGAASSAVTYDANGNVASRTDFNGAQTTFNYDLSRNLETKRVEGTGTSSARTISTEWHPSYRLIARQAEPLKITINSYDDKGNLLSKIVQATSDVNGSQGFAAATVGTARVWRYTYNAYGQVLTATGPRTDVNDVTTYTYDSQGNLSSVTNGAGQVTTLSNYDANGRVGKITDPNGLVTTLTYAPRGWLTSRTVGGEVTNYDYDGVGQLTKVTQPDGSYISYTYDDAHRLTAMADSAGNRMVYTLDAMGNRTKETVQDPSGALAQQTTRVYDALNRLQQITGSLQ